MQNTYQRPFPNVVRARHTKLSTSGTMPSNNKTARTKDNLNMQELEEVFNSTKNNDIPAAKNTNAGSNEASIRK